MLTSADHRTLFNSALLIGFVTLGAKGITLVRDMMIASRFGTSDANDAYVAGWALPNFLVGVVAGGIFGALVPIGIETRAKRGRARQQAVISEVMVIGVFIYTLVTVFILLANRAILPLVAQGYSERKFALAASLTTIMLPAVLVGGMVSIWSAVLNTENKFGLVAASPFVIPATTTIMLLVVPGANIEWIAASFVVGTGLQASILYLGLVREGIPVKIRWHGFLPETRELLGQFGVLTANGMVLAGLIVVDTAMAATLGPGNQSVLTYANKLIVPVLGISSTALGTAVLPYFSRLVAAEDWEGLRHTLVTYSKLIICISFPIVAGLIFFGRPLVGLLFQRGEFTAADTKAVAGVLSIYAFLIPIESITLMFSRVLLSLRVGKFLIYASIVMFLNNILADYVLKEFFGLKGIALASVLNQVLSLMFLLYMWRFLKRTRMTQR